MLGVGHLTSPGLSVVTGKWGPIPQRRSEWVATERTDGWGLFVTVRASGLEWGEAPGEPGPTLARPPPPPTHSSVCPPPPQPCICSPARLLVACRVLGTGASRTDGDRASWDGRADLHPAAFRATRSWPGLGRVASPRTWGPAPTPGWSQSESPSQPRRLSQPLPQAVSAPVR